MADASQGFRIKRQSLAARGQMMKYFETGRKSLALEKPMRRMSLQEQSGGGSPFRSGKILPASAEDSGKMPWSTASANLNWEPLPSYARSEAELSYSTSAWLNSISFDQMKQNAQRLGKAMFGLNGEDYEMDPPGMSASLNLSDSELRTKFMKRVTIVVNRLFDGKLGINLRTSLSAEQMGSLGSPESCSFPSYDDDTAGVVIVGFSVPAARDFGWHLFDEVVAVNGEPVLDRDEFSVAYAKAKESLPIHFAVLRRFGPEMRSIGTEASVELAQSSMQRFSMSDEFVDAGQSFKTIDELDKPEFEGTQWRQEWRHQQRQLDQTSEMTKQLMQQNLALSDEIEKCRGNLADFEYWLLRRQRRRNRRKSDLPLPGNAPWPWESMENMDAAMASTTKTPNDDVPGAETMLEFMSNSMSMQDVLQEARRMFRILDCNRSNTISRLELTKGLVNSTFVRGCFGLPADIQEDDMETHRRVSTIFRSMDKDNNKSITWQEFKQWILEHPENAYNVAKASSMSRLAAERQAELVRLSSPTGMESPPDIGGMAVQDSPDVQGDWRSDPMIAVPTQVQAGETQFDAWEDKVSLLFQALKTSSTQLTMTGMYRLAALMQFPGNEKDFETEFDALCKQHNCDATTGLDLQSFRTIISDSNGEFYCTYEALDELYSKLCRAEGIHKLFESHMSARGSISHAEMLGLAQDLGWRGSADDFSNRYETICEQAGADPAAGLDEATFGVLVDDPTSEFYCDNSKLSSLLSTQLDSHLGLETADAGKFKHVASTAKAVAKRKISGILKGPSSRGNSTEGSIDLADIIQEQEQQEIGSQRRRVSSVQSRPSAEAPVDSAAKRMARGQANGMAFKAGAVSPKSSRSGTPDLSSPNLNFPGGLLGLGSPTLSSPRGGPESGLLGVFAELTPGSAMRPTSSPMADSRRLSPELDPDMAAGGGGQRPGIIPEEVGDEDREIQGISGEVAQNSRRTPSAAGAHDFKHRVQMMTAESKAANRPAAKSSWAELLTDMHEAAEEVEGQFVVEPEEGDHTVGMNSTALSDFIRASQVQADPAVLPRAVEGQHADLGVLAFDSPGQDQSLQRSISPQAQTPDLGNLIG